MGNQLSSGIQEAPSGYRDPAFAVLFGLHLVGLFALAAFSSVTYESEPSNAMNSTNSTMPITPSSSAQTSDSDGPGIEAGDVAKVVGVFAMLGVASVLVTIFYLWLCMKFPKQIIIGTLIASIILSLMGGLLNIFIGNIIGGVIGILFTLFFAFILYMWRHRIPFAAAVLKTVVSVLKLHPNMVWLVYGFTFLQLVWLIVWVICFAFGYRLGLSSGSDSLAYIVYVYCLLSFYWTNEVLKNITHVSCSGVYATWYFMGGANGNEGQSPVAKALKRACTTSFGSICLGSLLVALIQTARALIRGMRNQGNAMLIQIADCLLGCIERLVRYFNRYAYTQVAIYGKSFCEAAKDTWRLAQSSGIDAVTNDNILSGVFSIGAVIGGIAVGMLGYVLGFAILSMTLKVIDSGVATIFVAFAMDPLALQRNDAELYNTFYSTYNGLKR